jgi:hypothetical protein
MMAKDDLYGKIDAYQKGRRKAKLINRIKYYAVSFLKI